MDRIGSAIEQLQELLKQEDPSQLHKLSEMLGISPDKIEKVEKKFFNDLDSCVSDVILLQDKLDCFRRDWDNYRNTRNKRLIDFAKKVQGEDVSKEAIEKSIQSYEVTSGTKEA